MHKTLIISLSLLSTIFVKAQTTNYFEPYKSTNLRVPSVPLLVNDPYFSFWSPYDHLYDGTTKHWDDQQKAIDGLLRVDGKVYRFMGGQRSTSIKAVIPMGDKGSYTAKTRYSYTAGWTTRTFNDAAWTTQKGPWGSGYQHETEWGGDNTDIYIRRHFSLNADELKDDYWLIFSHDDRYEIFVNGQKVASTMEANEPTWKQHVRVRLSDEARNALVAGDNVIAYHVHNTTGGAQADIGLYKNELGYHPGFEAIEEAGMAENGAWTAQVNYTFQNNNDWTKEDFNASSWQTQKGAFGSKGEYPNIGTSWTAENSDIYIRRKITLTADDLNKKLVLIYSHDDVCQAYINGRAVVATGNTWVQNVEYRLTDKDKAQLHVGDNIIAYHVHNTIGGAQADIGLYVDKSTEEKAEQISVDVLATNTYYTFKCGPVELDIVFTAPFLMNNIELMSTPINYISYRVRSTDGNSHNVQFYFGTTPELTVDNNNQPTISEIVSNGGRKYIKSGSQAQPILEKTGDNITIDWGYLYLPDVNGDIAIAEQATTFSTFASTGKLPVSISPCYSTDESEIPQLSYIHNFGDVNQAESYMMFGYDEVWDMIYMDKKYKGYWARNGKTIQTAFGEFETDYDNIMEQCKKQDKIIYDDAIASGNTKYAEILSTSYRQCIAAHKIFEDDRGNLLFFSKENNSNGCVNTVDLTYPSAPLFLLYNTELMKGMCTSILDYCQSNRWGFNFAAHDLGQYPHANNQVYAIRFPEANGGFGGNMPIEESANIIILAAAISVVDGNTNWADKYWDTLSKWTEYLVNHGLDPENQLCTDDFAGHLAHNANLAVKAIMGITGYAILCKMRGDKDAYDILISQAKDMAKSWAALDRDGNHYRLAYDRSDTWSQKYNMIWDKAWSTNIFPDYVKKQEMEFYKTKLNQYGLPLDSRQTYTKTDWTYWTAALADTQADFTLFSDLVWKYANETPSRVPLSDWYYTDGSANWVNFRARSVIGGHWMKVFVDKMNNGELGAFATAINNVFDNYEGHCQVNGCFNMLGQKVPKPYYRGVYIHNGEKIVVK